MGKQQVGHAFGAAAPYHAHKDPGRHKDKNHGDDILIPDALTHQRQLCIKGKRTVLQAGHQQGNQKRHHNGDIIKAHVDMKTVLKQQAEPEVDDQEYPDRQQGKGIAFFHFVPPFVNTANENTPVPFCIMTRVWASVHIFEFTLYCIKE